MSRTATRQPHREQRQKIFKQFFFDENVTFEEAKRRCEQEVPITDKNDAGCMKSWYHVQKKRKEGTYQVPKITDEQRERKREYDRKPEVIKKHCDANKKRRLEDPEHVREIERRSRDNNPINRKLTNFKCDNEREDRKIECTLTDDQIIWHFTQPCNYCGVTNNLTTDKLMGIDRVDNNLGFTKQNSLPCCFTCNLMKKDLPCDIFVNMAMAIGSKVDASFGSFESVGENATYKSTKSKLKLYQKGAIRRSKAFELTEKEFEVLCSKPCFYCGLIPNDCGSGIDRMNNSEGYSVNNCAACCKTCNVMKQKLSVDEFVGKCVDILRYKCK